MRRFEDVCRGIGIKTTRPFLETRELAYRHLVLRISLEGANTQGTQRLLGPKCMGQSTLNMHTNPMRLKTRTLSNIRNAGSSQSRDEVL
jgi:hypothetical protein